ncbi:MAG: hypothetical protein EAZ99_10605 [Alphaproteobacteria bacterium]|nr:hypothetical protein [Alphaproteobacteria bacterium]TAD89204.1 MAG: hypothetical protein EAZ99_10605 [Alphaproteobacteria bacterium]
MQNTWTRRQFARSVALVAIGVTTPAGAVRFETLDLPTAQLAARRCADEAALHRTILDALAAEIEAGRLDGSLAEAEAALQAVACPSCGCRLSLATPPVGE